MAGQFIPVPLTAIWCETLIPVNQTLKNYQKFKIQYLKNLHTGRCGECHIDYVITWYMWYYGSFQILRDLKKVLTPPLRQKKKNYYYMSYIYTYQSYLLLCDKVSNSVHFIHFPCTDICDTLSGGGGDSSMLTYIYLNVDEYWLTSSIPQQMGSTLSLSHLWWSHLKIYRYKGWFIFVLNE